MKRGQRTHSRVTADHYRLSSAKSCSDPRAAVDPPHRSSDTRVLWQLDLAKRYDVDRVTTYRWERANRLPPPDVIIGRHRGRYETTIIAFERASADRREKNPEFSLSVSDKADSGVGE